MAARRVGGGHTRGELPPGACLGRHWLIVAGLEPQGGAQCDELRSMAVHGLPPVRVDGRVAGPRDVEPSGGVVGPRGRRGAAILDGNVAARLGEDIMFTPGSAAGRKGGPTRAMLAPGGGVGNTSFDQSEYPPSLMATTKYP